MAKNYGSWSLKQLKEELQNRNAKTTGKKTALVQRLMDYDTIFCGLVNNPDETYHITTPSADLFRDVTSNSILPNINDQDLQQYNHLVDRENLDISKNMYEERFLQTSRVAYSGSEYYVTAVCSSQMKKSVTYNVTIKAKNNLIIESQCECAAGIGPYAQCKHVYVLIYGLIDFTNNKDIKRTTSCTSNLQKFHHPTAMYTGNPVKAEDLNLRIENAKRIAEFDPRPESSKANFDGSKYAEYVINQTINFCAHHNIKMPIAQLRKPANKHAFYHDHDYFEQTEKERYLGSLILNESEIKKLNEDNIKSESE